MGNASSALGDALAQFETTFCGSKPVTLQPQHAETWPVTLARITALLPYWSPDAPGRARAPLECNSTKALEALLFLLGRELKAVDLKSREYSFVPSRVLLLLEAIEKFAASKTVFKSIPTTDLSPLVLCVKLAARVGDARLTLHTLAAVTAVTERVNCPELKSQSKEVNQVRREAAAKEKWHAAGGYTALVDALGYVHARANPLLADALCRSLVSAVCVRQDTTPYEALDAMVQGLTPYHALLWEWSRSDYPRLRVAACALLRGLFLECDEVRARGMQACGVEWGALLWHTRLALRPTRGDSDFSRVTRAEMAVLQRLWSKQRLDACVGGDAAITAAPACRCSSAGDMIKPPSDLCVVVASDVDHAMAREASREMVALMCARSSSAMDILARVVPAPLLDTLTNGGTPRGDMPAPAPPVTQDRILVDACLMTSPVSRTPASMALLQQAISDGTLPAPDEAAAGTPPSSPALESLWSSELDMPVGVGYKGSLWWDASLCTAPRTRAQRTAFNTRIKFRWYGIVPAASGVHHDGLGGHEEDVPHVDATAPSSPDAGSDGVPATPPSAPTPAASAVVPMHARKAAAGGALLLVTAEWNWPAFWAALMTSPLRAPTWLWTRRCLQELRDQLWAEECGLDRRRRMYKRSMQDRGSYAAGVGVASSVVGAGVPASTAKGKVPLRVAAGAATTAAAPSGDVSPRSGRVFFGYDDLDDRAIMIPDIRGVPTDRLDASRVGSVTAYPIPHVPWEHVALQLQFSDINDSLVVDGVFIGSLLMLLQQYTSVGGSGASPSADMLALPAQLPTSLMRAAGVESNPRRRLALLLTLRLLVQLVLPDPDADIATDALSPLRVVGVLPRGLTDPSPPKLSTNLAPSAFESEALVSLAVDLLSRCNAGLGDVAVLRPMDGMDGAFASDLTVDAAFANWPADPSDDGSGSTLAAPTTDGDESSAGKDTDYVLVGRVRVYGAMVRITTDDASQSAMGATAALAGRTRHVRGEVAHWVGLWRQELLLSLRTLLTRTANARVLGNLDASLPALLPLLVVPAGSDSEPSKSATASAAPASATSPPVPSRASASAQVHTSLPTGFAGARDVLAVPLTCSDTGVEEVQARILSAAAAASHASTMNPFAMAVAADATPSSHAPGGAASAPLMLMQGERMLDPDVNLSVSQTKLSQAFQGRLAAEAILASLAAWPALSRHFAREDIMQATVLPLLQAPDHPRIVTHTLRTLRLVLPHIPEYWPALTRHAMFAAVLLTAIPHPASRAPAAPAAAAVPDDGETESSRRSYRGVGDGGLSEDAAVLLHDFHLACYDVRVSGWLEFSQVPQHAAARMLVDDVTVPSAAAVSSLPNDRSHRVTSWSAADATVDAASADAHSELATMLPGSMVTLLRKRGPDEFARVFNADTFMSSTAMWSADLRATLLHTLQVHLSQLILWVRGTALPGVPDESAMCAQRTPDDAARADMHPCLDDTHERMLAANSYDGLPPRRGDSVPQTLALQRPYSARPACSSAGVLTVPSVRHVPPPIRVRYPQLEDEPRVAGTYLRMYVSGAEMPANLTLFGRALFRSLHAEVAALAAAHLALAQAGMLTLSAGVATTSTSDGGNDVPNKAGNPFDKAGVPPPPPRAPTFAPPPPAKRAPTAPAASGGKKAPPAPPGRGGKLALSALQEGDGDEDESEGTPVAVAAAPPSPPRSPAVVALQAQESAASPARSSSPGARRAMVAQTITSSALTARTRDPLQLYTAAYRRHHFRVLLTLQALRRLLSDAPGTRMDSGTYSALGILFGLPLGKYPSIASKGAAGGGVSLDEATDAVNAEAEAGVSIVMGVGSAGGGETLEADVVRMSVSGRNAHAVASSSEDMSSDIILSTSDVFVADALPPLPPALELLLPPDAVAGADPTPLNTSGSDDAASASAAANEEDSAVQRMIKRRASRVSVARRITGMSSAQRSARADPSGPSAATLGNVTHGVNESPAFYPLRSALHAAAVRGMVTGRDRAAGTRASGGDASLVPMLLSVLLESCGDTVSVQAGAAVTGVLPCGDAVSLLSAALDVLLECVRPASQRSASRKAVATAKEASLFGQITSYLAWAVPLQAARTEQLLNIVGITTPAPPSIERMDDGCILPSAVDVSALSPRQRIRVFLHAPAVIAALRLISHSVDADAGALAFVEQPGMLAPVLRCARAPWDHDQEETDELLPLGWLLDDDMEAPSTGSIKPWAPTLTMCMSALLRCVPPAQAVLMSLSGLFQLRRALLDMGAVVTLLQTAVAGPLSIVSRPQTTGRPGAAATAATAPLASRTAAAASVPTSNDSRRGSMAVGVGIGVTSAAFQASNRLLQISATSNKTPTGASDAMDYEDMGETETLGHGHLLPLKPLRQAATRILRTLCDKSSSGNGVDDGKTGNDALFADIASDVAGSINDAVAAAAPAAPVVTSSAATFKRGMSMRMNAHTSASAAAAAASLSRLTSAASFAVSAAERSVRGAPPSQEQLEATSQLAAVVANFLTPGVFRVLLPSMMDSLAATAVVDVDVLQVLRNADATELPSMIWTPAMRTRLLRRLSHEAAFVDRRIVSNALFRRITGTDPELAADAMEAGAVVVSAPAARGGMQSDIPTKLAPGIGSSVTADVPSKTANPFGPASPGGSNPFGSIPARAAPVGANPFGSAVGAASGASSSNPFGSNVPSAGGASSFNPAAAAASAAPLQLTVPRNAAGALVAPAHADPSASAPILWAAERYTLPDMYRVLYPALADELVVEGVYVRVYMNAPSLEHVKPDPFTLANAILRDMDALQKKFRLQETMPAAAQRSLCTLLRAGAQLFTRLPHVAHACCSSSHVASLCALILRDLHVNAQAMMLGAYAVPGANGASSDAAGASLEQWSDTMRAGLAMMCVLTAHPSPAKVASQYMHALHVLLRREELAGSATAYVYPDGNVAMDDIPTKVLAGAVGQHASATAAASSLDAEDDPSEPSRARRSVASAASADDVADSAVPAAPAPTGSHLLYDASTSALALGVLSHILLHCKDRRMEALQSGILLTVLSVLTETLQCQSPLKRMLAVQALAAGMGAGAAAAGQGFSVSAASDGSSWRPTWNTSCLLLSAPPSVKPDVPLRAGGGDAEIAAVQYVTSVTWPLFDNAKRKRGALDDAWIRPSTVMRWWDATVDDPLLVWNIHTREDVQGFVRRDWATLDEWLSVRPEEAMRYRLDNLFDRLTRPYLGAALVVGDVFVRQFNAKPHNKDVDAPIFLGAAVAKLQAAVAFVASPARTPAIVADCVELWTAIRNLLEGHVELQTASGVTVWGACVAYSIPAMPPSVVPSVAGALVPLFREIEILRAVEDSAARAVPRLMHVTHTLVAAVAGSLDAPGAIAVLPAWLHALSDAVRRSSTLARRFLDAGMIVLAMRVILAAAVEADSTSTASRAREDMVAACSLLATMVNDSSAGKAVRASVCESVDATLATDDVFARRADAVAIYLQGVHTDSRSGRVWNAELRARLLAFFEAEATTLAVTRVSDGIDAWDARRVLWDTRRLRSVFPTPLDVAWLE